MIQKYLPNRFHMAMLQIYDDASAACRGYRPPQFLQLVSDKGGLEAARFLLRGTKPACGFTELFLCKRLDLSLEALVTLEPWCQLFTPEELGQARRRLAHVGFFKPTTGAAEFPTTLGCVVDVKPNPYLNSRSKNTARTGLRDNPDC